MRSDDLGITWYGEFPERFLEFLETDLENIIKTVIVPWENLPADPIHPYILTDDIILEGNRSFTEWGGKGSTIMSLS